MLFRMLLGCALLLMWACRGDYRKAQWHYNIIMLQHNEIVGVMERLELGFSDTASYRAVNEKMDSLHLLTQRLQSTCDTISLPDEDASMKEASMHWTGILQNEIFPLYHEKINLWKMMHIQQNNKDVMRLDALTKRIEEKKTELNASTIPAFESFVDDYKLSYRPL
jgi:hypothetical protein